VRTADEIRGPQPTIPQGGLGQQEEPEEGGEDDEQ